MRHTECLLCVHQLSLLCKTFDASRTRPPVLMHARSSLEEPRQIQPYVKHAMHELSDVPNPPRSLPYPQRRIQGHVVSEATLPGKVHIFHKPTGCSCLELEYDGWDHSGILAPAAHLHQAATLPTQYLVYLCLRRRWKMTFVVSFSRTAESIFDRFHGGKAVPTPAHRMHHCKAPWPSVGNSANSMDSETISEAYAAGFCAH